LELWTPFEIATTAWYDASALNTITEDDSPGFVSQWDDKKGGNFVIQGNGSLQPQTGVNTINGLNVLTFSNPPYTLQTLVINTNINIEYAFVLLYYNGGESLSQAVGSATLGSGNNYTIQLRADTNPDTWQNNTYTNGSSTYTKAGASAVRNAAAIAGVASQGLTNFDLNIGADRTQTNRGWRGYIGEVICGSNALTTDTKNRIEGYLAWKWGIESVLPSNHPYKNHPPFVREPWYLSSSSSSSSPGV